MSKLLLTPLALLLSGCALLFPKAEPVQLLIDPQPNFNQPLTDCRVAKLLIGTSAPLAERRLIVRIGKDIIYYHPQLEWSQTAEELLREGIERGLSGDLVGDSESDQGWLLRVNVSRFEFVKERSGKMGSLTLKLSVERSSLAEPNGGRRVAIKLSSKEIPLQAKELGLVGSEILTRLNSRIRRMLGCEG